MNMPATADAVVVGGGVMGCSILYNLAERGMTNPRFLARFVRERGLVSFEEAIRKMTMLPAQRMALSRRGRIAPGFAADLVVLDPDTVADTATFESPHSYPVGIPHVAVNGAVVIEDGEFTGRTPGKVIRGNRE